MTDADNLQPEAETDGRTPEERLHALGLTLPKTRRPVGNFAPAVLEGSLLFLSGQGPVWDDRKACGKVGREVSAEDAYRHARQAGLNLLANARASLGALSRVRRVVKVFGMVNAIADFEDHPRVINGCSDLFIQVFGPTAGLHARSAVGMASLPGNITVEIEAIFALEK